MAQRGFRPGSLAYEELLDIEGNMRRALGLPMPDFTAKCVMAWRLNDMRHALEMDDWDTLEEHTQRLAKMLRVARPDGQTR